MSLAEKYMQCIAVKEAVGAVLAHDITQIIPGETKGPVFRKGHIIAEDDIAILLQVGKENIYVYQNIQGLLHEDEAALRIARALCGEGLLLSEVSEGRINFMASHHGLLCIDKERLSEVNILDEVAVATLHSLQEIRMEQAVGGTRIIPLLIEESKIAQLESMVVRPIINIIPFKKPKVGIVTTGSEIYHGRIQDAFGPILHEKFQEYEATMLGQKFTSDDVQMTCEAIHFFKEQGADIIAVTGGMSVDPDDRTPKAIAQSGVKITTYGASVFPGAMFLHGMLEGTHILGLPGCVMYHRASIFELLLPRILAGIEITRKDIMDMGYGGFCASCPTCTYPRCAFGKG